MEGSMSADEKISHHVLTGEEMCSTPVATNLLRSSTSGANQSIRPAAQVLAPCPACQIEGIGTRGMDAYARVFQKLVQLLTGGETAS